MKRAVSPPWVAYVGPFPYPSGAAASRRVLGVAQSLVMGGFDVVIASGAGEAGDAQPMLTEQEPGIRWCRLPERVAEHWPRPLRRARYAWMGRRTIEWLDAQPTRPTAVILYSGYTPYLQRLLPWCRRNGVRLIFDAVEWYEPKTRLGYLASPYQWNIEWAMRRLVPKVDGVIAISSYLARHYAKQVKAISVVPPTSRDIGQRQREVSPFLELAYAGSPGGNKDQLPVVLRAVRRLADEGAAIRLTIAGPTQAEVAALLGVASLAGIPWVRDLGRLSYEDARSAVAAADFSVLLREDRRLANAGFPTKFVESFASGTPVIANLTSDLGRHLRHGETGLVCLDCSEGAMLACLREAMTMTPDEMNRMRDNCLLHARRHFAPSAYAEALRALVLPAGGSKNQSEITNSGQVAMQPNDAGVINDNWN